MREEEAIVRVFARRGELMGQAKIYFGDVHIGREKEVQYWMLAVWHGGMLLITRLKQVHVKERFSGWWARMCHGRGAALVSAKDLCS